MTNKQLDQLVLENNQVTFIKAEGERIPMPNLTTLVEWYNTYKNSEIGERIKDILGRDIEDLVIAEVMIDMNNEVTKERLRSGEISKNLGHVMTYSVILDSHLERAKEQFEALAKEGKVTGKFEDCIFTKFPIGTIIMRDAFKQYKNDQCDKQDIEAFIKK